MAALAARTAQPRAAAVRAATEIKRIAAEEAAKPLESKYDRSSGVLGIDAARRAAEECFEVVRVRGRASRTFLYLFRVWSPRRFEVPLFKIGFTACDGTARGAGARTFADRIREINSEHDCCLGHEPSNIIVAAVARISTGREEAAMHAKLKSELKEYHVPVENPLGGKHKEFYKISPVVYLKFVKLCGKQLSRKEHLWKSQRYVLGDDGGETLDGELLL